jgi:hypothetical protein
MNSPDTPRPHAGDQDFDEKTLAWLELKRELEQLHARLEYLKLVLKLRVRVH